MTDTAAPTVTLNRMNAADSLVLLGDVIPTLKAHGVLVFQTDGHWTFANPSTGELIAEASAVETMLKEHGLNVPPNVDRIIQLLPALLPMLGVS